MLLIKFNTPIVRYRTMADKSMRVELDMGEVSPETSGKLQEGVLSADVNMIMCDTLIFSEFLEFIYSKGWQGGIPPRDIEEIKSFVNIQNEKRGPIVADGLTD